MGGGIRKTGQAGGGGASRAQDATGLALCYLISPQLSPRWLQNSNKKRPARRPQQRTPGWCFINMAATGQPEIDNKNRPEPRAVRGAPLASEGRYFIELNQFNLLFAVGAGNNFLHCTAAEGGRERPCKAQLGAGRPRNRRLLISAGLLGSRCDGA